jgi:hypothetical protein
MVRDAALSAAPHHEDFPLRHHRAATASAKRSLPLRDPVIHTKYQRMPHFIMDGRVKPGHDEIKKRSAARPPPPAAGDVVWSLLHDTPRPTLGDVF